LSHSDRGRQDRTHLIDTIYNPSLALFSTGHPVSAIGSRPMADSLSTDANASRSVRGGADRSCSKPRGVSRAAGTTTAHFIWHEQGIIIWQRPSLPIALTPHSALCYTPPCRAG
jgi:hypothetical protein